MNEPDYRALAADPATRRDRYSDLVRGYYDLVTPIYLEKWGESFHFALFKGDEPLDEAMAATERWIADRGGFRPGMKVLDVGCGVGGPALTIADHSGAHVTGLNIVESHLAIARDRAAARGLAAQCDFVLGDAMDMPFADGSFDAVYIFEAGCHMPDKPRLYRECFRVLKPGGTFIGTDWFKKDQTTPAEEDEFVEPICRLHGLPSLITLADLRDSLGMAGFSIQEVHDLAKYGNVLRNWEQIDNKAMRLVGTYLRFMIPETERMMLDGALKLIAAARAGVFLIGTWKAVKEA